MHRLVFYALTIIQEGRGSSGKLLTAKLALRMLAKLYITFRYLVDQVEGLRQGYEEKAVDLKTTVARLFKLKSTTRLT